MSDRWKTALVLGATTALASLAIARAYAPPHADFGYLPDAVSLGCMVATTVVCACLVARGAGDGFASGILSALGSTACLATVGVLGGLVLRDRAALTTGVTGPVLLAASGATILGCVAAIDAVARAVMDHAAPTPSRP